MTSLPTAIVLTFGEALVGYASVEANLRIATHFAGFPVVQTSMSPSASHGLGSAPPGRACWATVRTVIM
jgi:hypothetical protein